MDTEDTPPVSNTGPLTEEQVDESTEEDSLVKESCHDSGIDIRDTSIPPIVPVQTNKKVTIITYSQCIFSICFFFLFIVQ